MLKQKKFFSIITCVLLIFVFTSCKKTNVEPVAKSNIVLGTFCTVTVYDKVSTDVLEKVFDELSTIEDKMSINKDTSEVININSKSGLDYVNVSDDTFYVIQKGTYYSQLSNGKFDISIGPIVKLWNIGTDKARLPSTEEIKNKLPLVNHKNILINQAEKKVMLNKKDMRLDLGGIAKGYAADEAKKILKENGVNHAIINLGGNILTLGNKPNKSNWKLGVQNPFEPRGKYLGTLKVADKSVVTSGVYERYFEKDGKRYHHILNPKDGYPVTNSLVSVSIISDNSIDGDALSTTAFALGLNDGLKLIESLDNIDAIFVTKDSDIYISSGLKNIFEIKNDKFKLKN
ncbi:FAD:protein FMN transferase [Clostridium aestuarii]|uniref:FAD:protein FMN transferase n=1 Tax=Clostridium aestuarii TaxID=338193 RepID=A0ABT4D3L5_9CLOT|nr:FAD:protein FMN transferase [Clostridium aestuarii]MCY6484850.1 FAD:protein FMN transferase [Clostridium aestuarii]